MHPDICLGFANCNAEYIYNSEQYNYKIKSKKNELIFEVFKLFFFYNTILYFSRQSKNYGIYIKP
jgi:hypothetical protein